MIFLVSQSIKRKLSAGTNNYDWLILDNAEILFGFIPLNHSDAEAFCTEQGGILYEPNSFEESVEVSSKFQDFGRDLFWTGITDGPVDGRLVLICVVSTVIKLIFSLDINTFRTIKLNPFLQNGTKEACPIF